MGQEHGSNEIDIVLFFSSETLAKDTRNHCVPIYEVLQVPDNDNMRILVMPLLRDYNDPQIQTVGEAVEFFHQMFEVLVASDSLDTPLKLALVGIRDQARKP